MSGYLATHISACRTRAEVGREGRPLDHDGAVYLNGGAKFMGER
jgi:hypothetical protein